MFMWSLALLQALRALIAHADTAGASDKLLNSGPHIPNRAPVSYTPDIPQHDLGDCLGLYAIQATTRALEASERWSRRSEDRYMQRRCSLAFRAPGLNPDMWLRGLSTPSA